MVDDLARDDIWMKALAQFVKKGYSDQEIAKQRAAWVNRIDSHGKQEADKSLVEQASGVLRKRGKQLKEAAQ